MMKTMTCNQLGGPCDMEFHAYTLDEMGEMSRKHAIEMAEKGDQAHIDKIDEMKNMTTNNPDAQKEWYENMQKEFDVLPRDE